MTAHSYRLQRNSNSFKLNSIPVPPYVGGGVRWSCAIMANRGDGWSAMREYEDLVPRNPVAYETTYGRDQGEGRKGCAEKA